jgi:hypothetical protein
MYFNYSPRILLPTLAEGIYCISATMLHRVYTKVNGPWTASYENSYRILSQKFNQQETNAPREERERDLVDLEQLRFGRLCRFLEHRRPDAIVANSILIYRLGPGDIAQALTGNLSY